MNECTSRTLEGIFGLYLEAINAQHEKVLSMIN